MVNVMHFMPISEFRKAGYLQELNRQFLHPLCLALVTSVDDTTEEETLMGIWDCRNDPEGIIFDHSEITKESLEKAVNVEAQRVALGSTRQQLLGFMVQPLEC